MFDNACTMFGITIENALQEQTNTGTDKQPKHEPRYSLPQLLADEFRLPAPAKASKPQGLAGLMNTPGVKVYRAKG